MSRPTAVALVALLALSAAACRKPAAPPPAPPAPAAPAPTVQPRKETPPPPLSGSQKVQIQSDFEEARKLVSEARALRLKGEQIEREQGHEAANDTLVAARKLYRKAVGATECWVEPEAGGKVSQRQVDALAELKTYVDERASWIKEDASMGQKLNAR